MIKPALKRDWTKSTKSGFQLTFFGKDKKMQLIFMSCSKPARLEQKAIAPIFWPSFVRFGSAQKVHRATIEVTVLLSFLILSFSLVCTLAHLPSPICRLSSPLCIFHGQKHLVAPRRRTIFFRVQNNWSLFFFFFMGKQFPLRAHCSLNYKKSWTWGKKEGKQTPFLLVHQWRENKFTGEQTTHVDFIPGPFHDTHCAYLPLFVIGRISSPSNVQLQHWHIYPID